MGIIKKLSSNLVSKIAAGEVIERPSYVVKELIENSLDAYATSIKVEIEESGMKRIVVTDNGIGMEESDIKICFLPHTTSKLYSDEDLDRIASYGFRGEALSSITAVAKLQVESKQKGKKLGSQISLSDQKVIPIGMPNGTRVIIEDLFASVPVRKKFLKTLQTEYRHILDILVSYALIRDDVNVELYKDRKNIFYLTNKQKIIERIEILLGEHVARNMIPVKLKDSYISISGYISKPQVYSNTTNKIYLYVNGRRIHDTAIVSIIKNAYANLLESHTYPIAILYINLPFDLVDVNIHPRKEIVKFIDRNSVLSLIYEAISDTLKENNLTFHNISWSSKSTSSQIAKSLKEDVLQSDVAQIGNFKKQSEVIQLHNRYLITETKSGVIFIDQHAAHEALLYRELVKSFLAKGAKGEKISLRESLSLDVSLVDGNLIKEYKKTFVETGFDFKINKNKIIVTAIPRIFEGLEIREAIQEMIDSISEERLDNQIGNKVNRMISYLACKNAIRFGQSLEKEEVRKLIEKLESEDFIYTCPHGRPVKFEISTKELEKLFYRR